MVIGYCVVPFYDSFEPTEVKGWCVVERTGSEDKTLNCYPTRQEAEAAVKNLDAQLHHDDVA